MASACLIRFLLTQDGPPLPRASKVSRNSGNVSRTSSLLSVSAQSLQSGSSGSPTAVAQQCASRPPSLTALWQRCETLRQTLDSNAPSTNLMHKNTTAAQRVQCAECRVAGSRTCTSSHDVSPPRCGYCLRTAKAPAQHQVFSNHPHTHIQRTESELHVW